jgi:hypothetical protein
VPAHPAVVDRVAQGLADAFAGDPGLDREVANADVAQGVSLVDLDHGPDRGGVDLEEVTIGRAAQAQRRRPGLVALALELGGEAVGDPLRAPAAACHAADGLAAATAIAISVKSARMFHSVIAARGERPDVGMRAASPGIAADGSSDLTPTLGW